MITVTDLFATYLSVGIFGSILILVILLLRPLLRKAPRNILCILWILAAVRLLLPFQLESRFSLQPADIGVVTQVTAPAPSVQMPEAPQTSPVPPVLEEPPATTPTIFEEPSIAVPTTPQEPITAPVTPIEKTPAVDYRMILSAVWLGVGLSLLLYAMASYCILRFKVREAVKCDDGAMESDAINGAFLLGYFKPTIYLPIGLAPEDREFILAHERSHIKRGDPWWKLIGLLCVCVHWYNPLVWLIYTLLCRDIEIACDERVIRPMELSDRKAYSMALLNSQKKSSGFFIYPVAFGEISLKQRIKNVLSYRKPALWITIGALILVAVVAVCFLTNPKPKDPDTDILSQAQTTEPTITTTEPTTVPHTEPTTEPPTTEPPTTEPPTTEPPTTEPPITEPPTTEPPTTEPPVIEPTPKPPKPVSNVIAEGLWDGGPTKWQITKDGTLTISGEWGIAEAESYIWKDYADVINKVVIDGNITTIPRSAFSGMTGVKSVQLNAPVHTIGQYAFARTGLTSFTSPASLRLIERFAFDSCSSMQTLTLQGGVETLESAAFRNCVGIKHLVLGASLKAIGNPSSKDNICAAFGGCTGIETAEIYTSALWEGLSSRKKLHSVVIGGNVNRIGDWMFDHCTSLTEVRITAPITEIWGGAFEYCSALTTIDLPDTLTSIQGSAFYGTGVTRITIPASVEHIGIYAFKGSAIEEIVFLGDFPVDMNPYAFASVTITAYYPADNETWTPDKLQDYRGNVTWIPM